MYKKITGKVVHGEKLGRKLGFPTANVFYSDTDIDDSVFYINIVIDKKIYRGMGSNMVKKQTFEAHIFDFDRDIYGKTIEIIILKKLRDNRRFDSLEKLVQQIQKDKDNIQNNELITLTFGSFDVTHKGHLHYLSEAKKYGTQLYTIIASDKNIEKIKGKSPVHNQKERQKAVRNLEISDKIILGSDTNPLGWIEKYKPHSICLGYDQRGPFVDKLDSEIKKLGLLTDIIRIDSLSPDKYKSSLIKKNSR